MLPFLLTLHVFVVVFLWDGPPQEPEPFVPLFLPFGQIVLLQVTFVRSALVRVAPVRSALVRSVRCSGVFFVFISAMHVGSLLPRLAPVSIAPLRSAPTRSVPPNKASLRLALLR